MVQNYQVKVISIIVFYSVMSLMLLVFALIIQSPENELGTYLFYQ